MERKRKKELNNYLTFVIFLGSSFSQIWRKRKLLWIWNLVCYFIMKKSKIIYSSFSFLHFFLLENSKLKIKKKWKMKTKRTFWNDMKRVIIYVFFLSRVFIGGESNERREKKVRIYVKIYFSQLWGKIRKTKESEIDNPVFHL